MSDDFRPLVPLAIPFISEANEARFWRRVLIDDGCWLWTAYTNKPGGYGLFSLGGRKVLAHCVSFKIFFGDHPEGKPFTLHTCDLKCCVRPLHLFAGTISDNARDMARKGYHKGHKLNTGQIIEIRELYASGMHQREVAANFGVTQALISRIVNGKAGFIQ